MKHFNVVYEIYDKIKLDKIFVYASHASFYIFISATPFITLSFFLTNIFLSLNEESVLKVIIPFFPNAVQSAAEGIIQEIFRNNSKGFISFSLISLLWSASRGISAIRRGLRQIYNLPPLSFIKDLLHSIAQLFFLLLIVLYMLLFTVIPNVLSSNILIFIAGFLSFIFLFALIYFLFTEIKFPFKAHIPGAITASLSWFIFAHIFSFYIKYFSNYSRIYGSLTTILIISLWIYFSIIIFFLGAEINTIIFSGILKKSDNKKELF